MADSTPTYIISVLNPNSDLTKNVSGEIVFVKKGPKYQGKGTLSNLPIPWTNTQTNQEVVNNTGSVYAISSLSSATSFDVLADSPRGKTDRASDG